MTEFLDSFASEMGETTQLHQPGNLPHAPLSVDAATVPLSGGDDPTYGEVRWRTLVNGTPDTPREMVFGIAEFGPGDRLMPHRHTPAEVYFGLEGSGVVTIDGVDHEIRAGVALYVPADAEHGTVAGPDGLRFVYSFASQDFESIVYRFSATA